MTDNISIPTYVRQVSQENYHDELNQTLRFFFDKDYWGLPNITNADVTALEPTMPVGAIWFNSSSAKIQVKTANGIVETVQSV